MQWLGKQAERDSFRSKVAELANQATAIADSNRIWAEIVAGRSSVLDTFATPDHSYLVITRDVRRPPLFDTNVRMLEGVLLGRCPKQVADDFGVATSTLAATLKQTLERIGVDCLPSRVPLVVVALIQGARGSRSHPLIQSCSAASLHPGAEILAIQVPSLAHLVPPMVEEVLRLHVAGKTHREIARVRGKSRCTVANQLSVAFDRIGASGRLHVLEVLLSHCQQERWESAG
jgi:hypothetical protein